MIFTELVHRADFLQLFGDEPLQEGGGDADCFPSSARSIRPLIRLVTLISCSSESFHRILGKGKLGDRLGDGGNLHARSGVDEELDELHRMHVFLGGLLVEVLSEEGQGFRVEMRRDGRVLDAGGEFVADLFVDLVVEGLRNEHACAGSAPASWKGQASCLLFPRRSQETANLWQWAVRQRPAFSSCSRQCFFTASTQLSRWKKTVFAANP